MVSKELHKDFTKQVQIISKHRTRAIQLLKRFKEEKKESEKQREEFEIQLKKAQQEKRYFKKAERKADKMYDEAQQRQNKAYGDHHGDAMTTWTDHPISKLAITVFGRILVAFFPIPQKSLVQTSETGDKLFYKEVMDKAGEEKFKHLKMKMKQLDMRREANQQCIEFAERIKNCQSGIEDTQSVIDALNNSVGALKSLYNIMMNAALFWEQMQTHCKALPPGKDLQTQVVKYGNAKNVWKFKKNAMNYCAKWVALVDVCDRYRQIKTNRT
ncbi:uncharacterized protein LOC114575091 [Exaiptasia diaphana]|uniref:Uncharacterized protein n=1 Tax=Exaiptasia diaphana TaxID=2652724 RepID=A0A913YJ19_EXADI|nr:uncharacterized protein LOC114575091 [Exaiptasia diaphana]